MVRVKEKKKKGDDAFQTRKQKTGRKKLAPATATRADVSARTLRLTASAAVQRAAAAAAATASAIGGKRGRDSDNNSNSAGAGGGGADGQKRRRGERQQHRRDEMGGAGGGGPLSLAAGSEDGEERAQVPVAELLSGARHYKAATRAASFAALRRQLLRDRLLLAAATAATGSSPPGVSGGHLYQHHRSALSASIAAASAASPTQTPPAAPLVGPVEKLQCFVTALETMTDTDDEVRRNALALVETILRTEDFLSSASSAASASASGSAAAAAAASEVGGGDDDGIGDAGAGGAAHNSSSSASEDGGGAAAAAGVVIYHERVLSIVSAFYVCVTHAMREVQMDGVRLLQLLFAPADAATAAAATAAGGGGGGVAVSAFSSPAASSSTSSSLLSAAAPRTLCPCPHVALHRALRTLYRQQASLGLGGVSGIGADLSGNSSSTYNNDGTSSGSGGSGSNNGNFDFDIHSGGASRAAAVAALRGAFGRQHPNTPSHHHHQNIISNNNSSSTASAAERTTSALSESDKEEEFILQTVKRVSQLIMKQTSSAVAQQFVPLLPQLLQALLLVPENYRSFSSNSGSSNDYNSRPRLVFVNPRWRNPFLVKEAFEGTLYNSWAHRWKELMELNLELFRREEKLSVAIAVAQCVATVTLFLKEHHMHHVWVKQQQLRSGARSGGPGGSNANNNSNSSSERLFLSRNQQTYLKDLFIEKTPIPLSELLVVSQRQREQKRGGGGGGGTRNRSGANDGDRDDDTGSEEEEEEENEEDDNESSDGSGGDDAANTSPRHNRYRHQQHHEHQHQRLQRYTQQQQQKQLASRWRLAVSLMDIYVSLAATAEGGRQIFHHFFYTVFPPPPPPPAPSAASGKAKSKNNNSNNSNEVNKEPETVFAFRSVSQLSDALIIANRIAQLYPPRVSPTAAAAASSYRGNNNNNNNVNGGAEVFDRLLPLFPRIFSAALTVIGGNVNTSATQANPNNNANSNNNSTDEAKVTALSLLAQLLSSFASYMRASAEAKESASAFSEATNGSSAQRSSPVCSNSKEVADLFQVLVAVPRLLFSVRALGRDTAAAAAASAGVVTAAGLASAVRRLLLSVWQVVHCRPLVNALFFSTGGSTRNAAAGDNNNNNSAGVNAATATKTTTTNNNNNSNNSGKGADSLCGRRLEQFLLSFSSLFGMRLRDGRVVEGILFHCVAAAAAHEGGGPGRAEALLSLARSILQTLGVTDNGKYLLLYNKAPTEEEEAGAAAAGAAAAVPPNSAPAHDPALVECVEAANDFSISKVLQMLAPIEHV